MSPHKIRCFPGKLNPGMPWFFFFRWLQLLGRGGGGPGSQRSGDRSQKEQSPPNGSAPAAYDEVPSVPGNPATKRAFEIGALYTLRALKLERGGVDYSHPVVHFSHYL